MAKRSVLVIGSGAGGSVAAWALAVTGHAVLILEKGRNLFPGLGTKAGVGSLFANDEVKGGRYFENQDVQLEPRTFRTQADASQGKARSQVGDVNNLPTTVGGGTVHWDAKTPRFWRQDFKGLSLFGPVQGANVADWPLAYEDLAPYYDEVEARLGVQGDVGRMPARTLAQAPRAQQFAMAPNPPIYGGLLLAEGARKLGYSAYPFPMAINSRPFHGRPRCNSCGFCSGFGCPINARGGAAVSFLHQALLAGARLEPRSNVYRVDTTANGRRATGVAYRDAGGAERTESADIIILAGSAIETARLLLLSANGAHPDGLGNRSGQVGRNLMFHHFTAGVGVFAEQVHAWRGPSTTFTLDDFVGPDLGPAAKAAGLPYLKGGICEVGGSFLLLQEAQAYASTPNSWGKTHKTMMRASLLRDHIAGISMLGEDMPQLGNRVDLDPDIKDVYGVQVPRITRSPHAFELAASKAIAPKLAAICRAAPGAIGAFHLSGDNAVPLAGTAHLMGTARMGDDPGTSVVDPHGQMNELDNVFIADGSVSPSSGGFNPTLTIMALSLRMARHLGG
ncbi:MAG TPA: GMC family oxidoreductase [Caulobacteraceae bacterium]|nr:GMC family oxidoreductase [Caulobacteraceae bacterium]